jgi:hypothetical protein
MKLHFNIHVATKHSLLLLLILLSLFLSMRKSSKYGKIDIHISNIPSILYKRQQQYSSVSVKYFKLDYVIV